MFPSVDIQEQLLYCGLGWVLGSDHSLLSPNLATDAEECRASLLKALRVPQFLIYWHGLVGMRLMLRIHPSTAVTSSKMFALYLTLSVGQSASLSEHLLIL